MNTSWSTSLLFVALLLVFTLPLFAHDAHDAYEPELASLDWQTGSLWNEDKAIRVRFRAEHSPPSSALYSNKTIGNGEVIEQIHVKGSPFQRFTVCARQIETEGAEILGSYAQANTDQNSTHWIRLEETEASLTLTGSHRCSESTVAGLDTQLRHQAHYQWQNTLISNAPFLVRYTKDKNTKVPKQRRKPASPFSLPISLFPDNEPAFYETGGGSWDTDDHDPFTKRPPFFPMQLSGGFSITLLPLLRLASNWQQYLPGTQSVHWLLGEPDQSAGLTLQLRFDGQSPVVLYISQAEFGELSEHLLNTRQLLHWLAPKLNGRAAFVQQLLELSESMAETTVWPEETLQSIQQQLAIILEQPDTEFSLIFEYHDLTGRLSNSLPPGSTQLGNTLAKAINPPTAGASASGQTSSGRTSTGRESNQQKKTNTLYPNLGNKDEETGADTRSTSPLHYTIKVHQTEYRLSRPRVLFHLPDLVSRACFLLDCQDCPRGGVALTDMLAHAEGHCLACDQCQHFVPGVGTLEARRRMLQSHTGSQCQNYQGEVLTPPLMDDGLTTLHFMFRFGTEETLLDLLQVFDLPITESHLQQRDRCGRTLLHDLAQYSPPPVIDAFIQRFKSIIKPEHLQIQDSNTGTPLHYMLVHFSQDQLQVFWQQCSGWLKPERLTMSTEKLKSPINLLKQRQDLPEAIVQPFIDRATLQLPKDINEQNSMGETILYRVARKGDTTTVKDLIQWGAQVDKANNNGATPLYIAAGNGHTATAERLIELGAQVDKAKNNGATPLYIAAYKGRTATAEKLIELGAQVDKAKNNGATPLYIAAYKGHTATAEKLIKLGAQVDKAEKDGATPLYIAAHKGHTATAALLIQQGANLEALPSHHSAKVNKWLRDAGVSLPAATSRDGSQTANKQGLTSLHLAVLDKQMDTVVFLLEQGASLRVQDQQQNTPLHYVMEHFSDDQLKAFWQQCSGWLKPKLLSTNTGAQGSPIDRLKQRQNLPEAIIQPFIDRATLQLPEDINEQDRKGKTILHRVARKGDTTTVKDLIQWGAQVDKANNNGVTPLYIAAGNGYTATAERLIELGAQVDKAKNNGATPLYIAAYKGRTATAEKLIELGAQVDKAKNNGATPLYIAAHKGHTATAALLIQQGANLEALPSHHSAKVNKWLRDAGVSLPAATSRDGSQTANKQGLTSLHLAVLDKQMDTVVFLLEQGASLRVQDQQQNTPLHYVMEHFSDDQLKAFWQQCSGWLKPKLLSTNTGAQGSPIDRLKQRQNLPEAIIQPFIDRATLQLPEDINEQDKVGETILHRVARKGDTTTVKDLIQWGAQVDKAKNNGAPPLYIAAYKGHTDTVQTLIDRGARIGGTTHGVTALMSAAFKGHTDTVQTLIDRGASVNQDTTDNGWTALMSAAKNGHPDTVQTLIDRGASVNQGRTDNGWTALMSAAKNGHPDTVQMLIDRGASVNQGRTDNGWTALMSAAKNGHPDTIQTLIDQGANVNQEANNYWTALMAAAFTGHTATVQTLIDRGANVNQGRTTDGWTALMAAAQNGLTATVQTLIDRGANVNQGRTTDGWTALMAAASRGRTTTVQTLIDQGANVNQGRTTDGYTALMFAAQHGYTDTAEKLIELGALED